MALPVRRGTDASRADPANEFDRLTQRLSDLFQEQWAVPSVLRPDGFTPMADVEESADAYLLEIEVPGIKKKEIDSKSTDAGS